MVLVLPRQGVQEELEDGVRGLEEHLEEEKPNHDGLPLGVPGRRDSQAGAETERAVERLVVDEDGEEAEDEEKV